MENKEMEKEMEVVEVGEINFEVLKIENSEKPGHAAVTLKFKNEEKEVTLVRKKYFKDNSGILVVDGCHIHYRLMDMRPYLVKRVYKTDGKKSVKLTSNSKPRKPKIEKPKVVEAKHEKYNVIKCCLENNIPIYLAGPAGSGKNYTVEQIAKELNWNFYFSNSVQQEYKLTGFIDAGGKFHETEFSKACKEAASGKDVVFFLDEMDASIPEVLVLLNAAIANGYFEFPDGKINFGDKVHFVSAGNTVGSGADEMYTGRMVLDQATLDRFAIIEFDYSRSIELLLARGNDELVNFVRALRDDAKEKGIRATFSYRCITMMAKLENSGMNLKEAIKISVMKGLDKDTINTFRVLGTNKYCKALREMQREM